MTNKLTTSNSKGSKSVAVSSSFSEQLRIFEEIAKGANTGIKTTGDALLIYQKAKELGIGWGNAISHMHIVNGKAGIDIHIVKAILSKPKSGITWKHTEDYIPIYSYTDGQNIFTEEMLPKNAHIVTKIKDGAPEGKFPVVLMPTNVGTDKAPNWQVMPTDYRSTYVFKRKKKDIDDNWIEEEVTSSFSWQQALAAKLPYDKNGFLNPDGAWQKYTKLMLNTRAFTFGAREICNDLLMGNHETSELYDINNINYIPDEEGTVTIIEPKE